MRTKLLTSFLFICTLLSCDPEKDSAPAPINTFDFSFRYDTHLEGAKDLELILTQEDGRVVLDTLIAFNTEHKLRIKSGDTKYNLTTVLFNPADNSYWMETFVQVNPDKWNLRYFITSNTLAETEKAEITYINTPLDTRPYFRTKAPSGYVATWNAGTLKVMNYTRLLPTDLAYLVLPVHGKYMFTEITLNQTTVDFTGAGNTVKRKYSRPAGVTNFRTYLDGYVKAGDDNSRISLYWSPSTPSVEYDLQYPPTGVEAFSLDVSYTDAGGYLHTYKSYGNQIPTEFDFAAASDFSVSKSAFDDFLITFADDKPSIYNMYWAASEADFNVRWNIYNSPERTGFIPKAFLDGLKSKKLEGKNLSAFKLSYVSTLKIQDQSYQGILDILANPTLALFKEAKHSRRITKYF
jgi:hypothetical protein